MTGFNYTVLRDNTAQPLIDRFGKDGTITATTSDGPAWNPGGGTVVTTETAVRLVQTEFKAEDRAGTLVQDDDLLFIVSTQGNPDIRLANTLTVDGQVYQIVRVMPLAPGPVTMLIRLHVRA